MKIHHLHVSTINIIFQLCTMKTGELFMRIVEELKPLHGNSEAEQIASMIFDHVFNFRRIDISLNREMEVVPSLQEQALVVLDKLKEGLPIQYILGYAWFYGMKLKVNKDVLIPRRETEQLVDLVINDIEASGKFPSQIIDFCTGSGCIAIALKKRFPDTQVVAVDVSEKALEVAKHNAQTEQAGIGIIRHDVLNLSLHCNPEIIISNPPYVLNAERKSMKRIVTDHEPELALFVPDDDPLLFYRKISEWGNRHLKPGGKIYYEINEMMGERISELHSHAGFTGITVLKDFQEKDRMFRCVKD